jgi:hypothetical protein
MTLTAFVADVHLHNHQAFGGVPVAGINRRCQMILDALQAAIDVARAQNCTDFVVLGDLFDTTRPVPQVVASLQRMFEKEQDELRFTVLMGNHDRNSGVWGDHALGPLLGQCSVVDRARGGEMVYLPFRPEPVRDWFAHEVGSFNVPPDGLPPVACGHFGLWDQADGIKAPWLADAPDAICAQMVGAMMADLGMTHLFVGNYHMHRAWRSGQNGVTHEVLVEGPEGLGRRVLGVDGRPAQRVRALHRTRRGSTVPSSDGLGGAGGADSTGVADRSSLSESEVCESESSGAGYPEDESSTWGESPGAQLSEDSLPSRARVHGGEHVSTDGDGVALMPNLHPGQVRLGDRLMVQVGALCPTGWDNPGLEGYGSVVVLDHETGVVERHEVAGPRFLSVSSEQELADLMATGIDPSLTFVRWKAGPGDVSRAMDAFRGLTGLAGFQVLPEAASVGEAVQRAAGARRPALLGEVVGELAATAELSAGVRRHEVERLVREFLGC